MVSVIQPPRSRCCDGMVDTWSVVPCSRFRDRHRHSVRAASGLREIAMQTTSLVIGPLLAVVVEGNRNDRLFPTSPSVLPSRTEAPILSLCDCEWAQTLVRGRRPLETTLTSVPIRQTTRAPMLTRKPRRDQSKFSRPTLVYPRWLFCPLLV